MPSYNSKDYLEEQLKTKTYLQIAHKNEVGKSTIQRKLKKFGLTKPRISWTAGEIQTLIENYKTAESVHLLFPTRTKSSVYHLAHKLGLSRPIRKRYKQVNEDFFTKWTKESCYVLGWMFSDGNVSKNERTFGFHLSEKDVNILKKIKKVMESEHNIYFRDNSIEFRVHSKKMCEDLISLGCMPKKTLKINFPENMPKKYINHFVRGYFDGDGSIMFNYPNTIKIRIVGNEKFIDALRKTVAKRIKIETPKIKKVEDNLWQTEFYGNNARRFCNWVYKDMGYLYLERKYTRFKNHIRKREAG